jgi:hypothetical protein
MDENCLGANMVRETDGCYNGNLLQIFVHFVAKATYKLKSFKIGRYL